MAKTKKILNMVKEGLITYSNLYLDQLTLGMVKEHWEKIFHKRGIKNFDSIIATEEGDKTDEHPHIHLWFSSPKAISAAIKSLRIPLKNPVLVVYKGQMNESNINSNIKWMKVLEEDVDLDNWTEIEKMIEEHLDDDYGDWRIYKEAHPRVDPKTFGYSIDIINYVTKQKEKNTMWSTDTIENLKKKYEKNNLKGRKRQGRREPDWLEWKKKGMTYDEVKRKLKEEYPNELMAYWYKWSSALSFVYGKDKEEFDIKRERDFWIPREVYNYFINVIRPYNEHRNDRKWLKQHRLDRPGSLVWVGPSQIGKTSFCRSIVENNYFQFALTDFGEFDEDRPLVILDDFSREVPKHLPSWKCWLGCQTDFTINPKFERRRTVTWGHPCIFLTNHKDIFRLDNGFTQDDIDYLKINSKIVQSNERKLWKEPRPDSKIALVKVNIGEFRKLMGSDPKDEDVFNEIINDNDGRLKLGKRRRNEEIKEWKKEEREKRYKRLRRQYSQPTSKTDWKDIIKYWEFLNNN